MSYTPTTPTGGGDVAALRRWIVDEFNRLARVLNETTALDLRPVGREPDKPREGMIISADGTNWNPGSGAGAYEYVGGVWVKL